MWSSSSPEEYWDFEFGDSSYNIWIFDLPVAILNLERIFGALSCWSLRNFREPLVVNLNEFELWISHVLHVLQVLHSIDILLLDNLESWVYHGGYSCSSKRMGSDQRPTNLCHPSLQISSDASDPRVWVSHHMLYFWEKAKKLVDLLSSSFIIIFYLDILSISVSPVDFHQGDLFLRMRWPKAGSPAAQELSQLAAPEAFVERLTTTSQWQEGSEGIEGTGDAMELDSEDDVDLGSLCPTAEIGWVFLFLEVVDVVLVVTGGGGFWT